MSSRSRGHGRWEREKVERDLSNDGVRSRVGADQIAYYQERAPWYDDVYTCEGDYDRGPALNAKWLSVVEAIREALLRAPLEGDCVELGAGTGYWTDHLVDRVDGLWALDAVPEALQTARTRLGPRASKVEFQVVDLWKWAPERVWDCAVACFFLEHVPDEVLPGLLGSLREGLRPGGVLFAAEAAAGAPEPQVETRLIQERRFAVVERRRSPAEFAEAFGAAGFAVEVTSSDRYVHLLATRA